MKSVRFAASDKANPWTRRMIKRCGRIEGGSGFPVEEQGLTKDEAEIPFFKVKDLQTSDLLVETDNYVSKETAFRLGATVFPPSTIVFAKVGAALLPNRFRFLGVSACIDNNMMAMRLDSGHSVKFMRYALDCVDMSANFNQGPVPSVNTRQVGTVEVPNPPLPEQKRIAAYLDASCAAIDAAVGAKRRQLESLESLAHAIVNKAVTKGINPSVSLMPSDMDWLPEIPVHWEVKQIKRVCEIVRGKFSHRPRNDPAFYEGKYPFVQTGDITAAHKYIRTYSQTLNELGLSVSKMFPRGTLVMSIAANIGDVAILDFEACFPDSMVGLIPGPHTSLDFLFYLMKAMKSIMLRSAVLSTQLNLNNVRIGTNFAAFPPKKEQEEIASFLNAKEQELNDIRATIGAQITTLLAYRKSLIHECVTGKRRISEADVAKVQEKATEEWRTKQQ